jgi:hypothetical protein
VPDLRQYLPIDTETLYKLRYLDSGVLAMTCTVSDVLTLARYNQVAPAYRKGKVSSIRLCVSVQAAHRTLKSCRVDGAMSAGAITRKRSKSTDMKWAQCFDRAKSGIMGGASRVWFQGAGI